MIEDAAFLGSSAGPLAASTSGLWRERGLLVVGHGTADPVGAAETREIARQAAAALPGVPVALGFLEVIGPTIDEALKTLAAAGCREVVASPLLLFEAGHAKRDLPEAITAAAAALGLIVHRAEPLGCHAAMVELSRRRRREAIARSPDVEAEAIGLVMVGRGSSDPTTPLQLEAFTAATLAPEPRPGLVLHGFVAAARPTVSEALAIAGDPARDRLRRIIVQPHLLFRGHVEEQVSLAVAEARRARPDLDWVQVHRLGPDPLVARALVERAVAAATDVAG